MKLSLKLILRTETWPFQRPLRISGHTFTGRNLVLVELVTSKGCGRGEAWCVHYNGETVENVCLQIETVASEVEKGISRDELQKLLPPGGARNALDCAMWDLEAKLTGKSIWALTGIDPTPVTTAFTIGIEDTAGEMAAYAAQAAEYPILKIKLDGNQPIERITAIRTARPDATLVVDANQGWTFDQLKVVAPFMAEQGVEMIEQPLPRGGDSELEGYRSPVMLSADESCLHRGELEQAARRYQMINIKLDKTGGLTEALLLAKAIKAKGLDLMVGNMGGTSLSMAPGFVVSQLCRFIDLDGPLILKNDRVNGIEYRKGVMSLPESSLWG